MPARNAVDTSIDRLSESSLSRKTERFSELRNCLHVLLTQNSIILYVNLPAFYSTVDRMLSFELSAMDIVLLVAVLILLSLYVTKIREKPQNQLESKTEQQVVFKRSQKTKKEKKKTEPQGEQPKTDFECAHHFGYLRNLPRNTPVPEECFGCPKVMQCLFPND